MKKLLRCVVLLWLLGMGGARMARAIEVKVSAKALERTLRTQLFNGPDGRYYMSGDASKPCAAYAEDPHVTFKDDRVVVRIHTRSKLGKALGGKCLGVSLATVADVLGRPRSRGRVGRFPRCADRKDQRVEGAELSAGPVPQPQAALADGG